MNGNVISVNEAARIMRCSKSWVLQLLASGALRGSRIHAKAWAVERASAEANRDEYLKSGRRVGRPRADNPPAARLAAGTSVGSNVMVTATKKPIRLDTGDARVRLDELRTVPHAAEAAGFHKTWLYGMIAADRIWSVNIDGVAFVRLADVLAIQRKPGGRPRKNASA